MFNAQYLPNNNIIEHNVTIPSNELNDIPEKSDGVIYR